MNLTFVFDGYVAPSPEPALFVFDGYLFSGTPEPSLQDADGIRRHRERPNRVKEFQLKEEQEFMEMIKIWTENANRLL